MDKVLEILKELHPEVDFDKEVGLIDNAILDSLDIVTIITELSDAFDIEIPVNYLFIWLHQVLVAAHSISVVVACKLLVVACGI